MTETPARHSPESAFPPARLGAARLSFLSTARRFVALGSLASLLFAAPAPARADTPPPDDCSEAPADAVAPGLAQIPAWDQQDTLLCYAYSAAVLVDAYRLAHGTHPRARALSSPLALAAQTVVRTAPFSPASGFFGGNASQALETARELGTCDAGWLSDGLGSAGVSEVLARLRGFQARYAAGTAPEQHLSVAVELHDYLAGLGAPSLPEAARISEDLALAPDLYLGTLIGSLCAPKTRLKLPAPTTIGKPTNWQDPPLATRLNGLLHEKKPVALEFCAESVTQPGFYPDYDGVCNRHYAVAVAQRNRNGRCEVQLRDSQCSQYHFPAGQPGCTGGLHWMDRLQLMGNTFSLHWL